MTARFLHREFFTFTPVLKLVLAVNHRPVVTDDSRGMWRRVQVVPFSRSFAKNKTLEAELQAEAEDILAWVVRGCLLWRAEGLGIPDSVKTASSAYKEDSDPLADFLATKCEESSDGSIAAAAFYQHYKAGPMKTV